MDINYKDTKSLYSVRFFSALSLLGYKAKTNKIITLFLEEDAGDKVTLGGKAA